MELYRTQILLGKKQHETLSQIAEEEKRSLSEIVREMIDRELLYRQRRQMLIAARELQADYQTDPSFTDFTALDGENFLFEDEINAEG
ncbi:MAG TPA: ribbon-helix-helix protein, CopG family [Anaerolineales bacterium]|nr:ribbon-helix-helix protein, CopG family [Anaerolineales bacterium]